MNTATALLIAFLSIIPGPVPADIVRVIDGDTVLMDVYSWPDEAKRTYVRVDGIDTPEMRGKCEAEKIKARQAKAYVEALSGPVTLFNVRLGKYAKRVLATVRIGGVDVGDALVGEGLAVRYDGGARQSWCRATP